MRNKKTITLLLMALFLATACSSNKDFIGRDEYYTRIYTSGIDACKWTQITCYAGDKRPENVTYQDNVCRYYLEYGKLTVGKTYNDPLQDVVFTQNGNCVFRDFHSERPVG